MIRWNLLYLQANPARSISACRPPKRYYAMPALAALAYRRICLIWMLAKAM